MKLIEYLGIVWDDRLNWKSHIRYEKIKLAKQLVSWRNGDPISHIHYDESALFFCLWVPDVFLYMFGVKTYASNLDCLNKFQKRIVR